MAETGSCAACENRHGRYSIGGGRLCKTCMSDLNECGSKQSVTTWHVHRERPDSTSKS